MIVKHWMISSPITAREKASVDDAYQMMKEKGINRLPVVDEEQKLKGIITKGDCLRVSPSPASTLSKQEANYLLGQLTVAEVMTKQVVTVNPETLIEEVALILRNKKIEGLPVVANDRLVGIITKSDIFDAFMDIMGVEGHGIRLILEAENRCGVLADVSQTFKQHGVLIDSVAKIHRNEHNKVYLLLRFNADKDAQESLFRELAEHGHLLESVWMNGDREEK